MPEFHFDEDSHTYTLDGRRIESVTEVLKDVGLTDCYGTEFDLLRGQLVHEACRLRLAGQLDESTVDDLVVPYLAAFDSFLSAHVLEVDPWVSEVPTWHPTLLYGGTPDIVGVFNGRRCLIDIKSGCLGTATAYQVCAYASMPQLAPIDGRFGLQLKADGSYNLKEYKNKSDFDIWISALNVYRAKR